MLLFDSKCLYSSLHSHMPYCVRNTGQGHTQHSHWGTLRKKCPQVGFKSKSCETSHLPVTVYHPFVFPYDGYSMYACTYGL